MWSKIKCPIKRWLRKYFAGLGHSSEVGNLPSMYEALCSIPRTSKSIFNPEDDFSANLCPSISIKEQNHPSSWQTKLCDHLCEVYLFLLLKNYPSLSNQNFCLRTILKVRYKESLNIQDPTAKQAERKAHVPSQCSWQAYCWDYSHWRKPAWCEGPFYPSAHCLYQSFPDWRGGE